jgi:hypothetical protein
VEPGRAISDKEALRDNVPPFGLSCDEPAEDIEPWQGDKSADWEEGERMYGFWKAKLCVGASAAFEYAQAAEARTRFFFGMLWAARWSLRLMFFAAAILWTRGDPRRAGIVLGIAFVLAFLGTRRPTPRAGRLGSAFVRFAFWFPVVFEVLATADLFLRARAEHLADPRATDLRELVLPGLLLVSSAILFLFLGTKLRRVRAQELRAVYLNYVALVLSK